MLMTRSSLGLLIALLVAAASCQSHRPPPRPTETLPPNDVQRLSDRYPDLKQQWLAYRAKEGDGNRGDAFSNVAMRLDQTCFTGSPVSTRTRPADRASETEVLSFLGLPDSGRSEGKDAVYVYSYWRTDTKNRWVAIVQIKDGLLEQIGWNDASVNDFSMLTPYREWSDLPAVAHRR